MPQPQSDPSSGGRFAGLRRLIRGYPLLFVLIAVAVAGVIAVPTTEAVDRYFSSNAFCAEACHVMAGTVATEYRQSAHWNTSTGVRPTCADCHLSEGLTGRMIDHVLGLSDLYAFTIEGIRTPEDFEHVRAATAERVRFAMLGNDSKTCRNCHVMEAIKPERVRGQRQHETAIEDGTTCIACHYNVAHKEVEPSEAFLDASGY